MAPVGPTQWETQWRVVLASFDKQHETLIDNNPGTTEKINLIRTELVKIGQLFQTSPLHVEATGRQSGEREKRPL
jgi:hypothetical protein